VLGEKIIDKTLAIRSNKFAANCGYLIYDSVSFEGWRVLINTSRPCLKYMTQYCTCQAYHQTIDEVDKFRILYSKCSLAIEILTVYGAGNLGCEESELYSLCRVVIGVSYTEVDSKIATIPNTQSRR